MDEKNTVDAAEVDEAAETPEEHGFHEVDGDGHVYGRSSGDYTESEQDKVDYVTENEPVKYEGAAHPLPSPLETAEVPERHEHTAHDVEGRELTVDDADFDADQENEVKPNGNED
jgi:hypothetical protein